MVPQKKLKQSDSSKKKATDHATVTSMVLSLRERYPTLTPGEVAYFQRRQSIEAARKAGARTVASAVLSDMIKLAVRYEQARQAKPIVASMVTSAQMRWLCDNLVMLGAAVDRRDHKGTITAMVSINVQTAWDNARTMRNQFVGAMEECAAGVDADATALASVRGEATKPDTTQRSLAAMVVLSRQWIARTDEGSQIAAREASLNTDLIARAHDAAQELREALDADAVHDGNRRTTQDTPEINALEGHVTLSLKMVRDNHERAREIEPTVEVVMVPDSLKRAMRIGTKSKSVTKAVTPEATPEASTPRAAPTKIRRRTKRR
jgi:hypothetical protein